MEMFHDMANLIFTFISIDFYYFIGEMNWLAFLNETF